MARWLPRLFSRFRRPAATGWPVWVHVCVRRPLAPSELLLAASVRELHA